MLTSQITAIGTATMTIGAALGEKSCEFVLQPSSHGGVNVSMIASGAWTVALEVRPDVEGTWKPTIEPDSVVADFMPAVLEWARRYAVVELDRISHSLVGKSEERLFAMECLLAGVRDAGASAERPQSGYSQLPPMLLMESPIGTLTVSFGSENVADVGIPCRINPARGLGYVRFLRDSDMGWQPEPAGKWDLSRCADRLDRSAAETVTAIMLPLIARAFKAGRSTGNTGEMKPAGTTAALADDIQKLSRIVATKRADRPVFGRRAA